MQHDPWSLQVAMLGGTSARSPSHWQGVHRHIVNDFAQAQSARLGTGLEPGAKRLGPGGPLSRDASDLELIRRLRETGPMTIAQFAMCLQTEQPVAWERMHSLARRGLVRRQAGAWAAVSLTQESVALSAV